jgi:hypothetical protein
MRGLAQMQLLNCNGGSCVALLSHLHHGVLFAHDKWFARVHYDKAVMLTLHTDLLPCRHVDDQTCIQRPIQAAEESVELTLSHEPIGVFGSRYDIIWLTASFCVH